MPARRFAGWRLILLPEDVAKIASFIGIDDGAIGGVQILDAALQRNLGDRGIALTGAQSAGRYHFGFWAWNVRRALSYANDRLLPFMSGAGGTSVWPMYNRTVCHQFSDNDLDKWLDAALQPHKIWPLSS